MITSLVRAPENIPATITNSYFCDNFSYVNNSPQRYSESRFTNRDAEVIAVFDALIN